MCEWKPDFDTLARRVDGIETRIGSVEQTVGDIRRESQNGFSRINDSISSLATEFGTRMNTMEQRIVEEKTKWGDVLRWIVKTITRVIAAAVIVACGINVAKSLVH